MIPETPSVLIPEKEIRHRVGELARQVSADYDKAEELLLVGVLRGCFIFLADLSRLLTVPRRIDFMALAAYGQNAATSGAVRLIMDLRPNIAGKHVLIVEDIVDTGNTLEYLLDILLPRKPATLKTCVLLQKRERLEKDVKIDYLGFDIPDLWVVGYGLDYADRHRALPYIGVVENEGKGISRCTTRIGKRTGGRGRKHSRISWKGASRNRPGGNREKG
jgi:hypoxanthine phosphoribosyltransferase